MIKRFVRVVSLLGVVVTGASCRPEVPDGSSAFGSRRTCIVLSVGGPNGVAHLGALEAARQAGLRIDCVVGNSMGALVGSLYATAPGASTTDRFLEVMAKYKAETKHDKVEGGVGLGLLGGLLMLATGGLAGPVLAAGATGGALGVGAVNTMDRRRTERVLDAYFGHASIEDLPMPYATFYMQREGESLAMHAATTGNLAQAVSGSIANPYIFPDVNAKSPRLDPGADRIATTPVEDACRLFPDARLLAINVSGQSVFYSDRMHCPLRTVDVPITNVLAKDVISGGPTFQAARASGFAATLKALSAGAW